MKQIKMYILSDLMVICDKLILIYIFFIHLKRSNINVTKLKKTIQTD